MLSYSRFFKRRTWEVTGTPGEQALGLLPPSGSVPVVLVPVLPPTEVEAEPPTLLVPLLLGVVLLAPPRFVLPLFEVLALPILEFPPAPVRVPEALFPPPRLEPTPVPFPPSEAVFPSPGPLLGVPAEEQAPTSTAAPSTNIASRDDVIGFLPSWARPSAG
jgi:hypothetical protein